MENEEKNKAESNFGKVVDALHNKSKLSSLRTYQGDTALFIKSKNESVISIAAKEKMRDDERKNERKDEGLDKIGIPEIKKESGTHFSINMTMLALSLFLIVGGVIGSFYIFKILNRPPQPQIQIEKEVIPFNNKITFANATSANLGDELTKVPKTNGITIIEIGDATGKTIETSKEFLQFLKISLPATLTRTLEDEYALGIISQNGTTANFIILTINDFGRAFSAMLDWEEKMESDLSFLSAPKNTGVSTTPEIFIWKDIIIKNKDVRTLANAKNQSKISYTFLDKNTILIVNDLSNIGDLTSAYSSRAVAR
jgi:hypothetical protein